MVTQLFVSTVKGQTLSHSVIPTTVTRQSMEIDESSGDATHVVRVDNYSSRCPGSGMQSSVVPMFEQPQHVTSIVNNRSQARRDRTRHHPTATAGSSSQHTAPSGPPLEYKDLRNCAHSCQHCVRVFEMKIHKFVNYLRDAQPFGKVRAGAIYRLFIIHYGISKRGLPHCYTLLWIDEFVRPRRDEDINMYVSAELPAQHADPQGYKIVSELMMHGPCGLANPSAPCTQNSKCKKDFPKEYCNQTYVDKSGFVHYKRRDTGVTTTRHNVGLDNRYVVPYNKQLLLAFYAHINVEYCGWTMLIKYLFKYISKGTDRVVACISRNNPPSVDPNTAASTSQPQIVIGEIKNYLDARYVSPHEACWRIFEFEIHYREPAVQILAVH
ncbi:hypothetical protein Tco_1239611, partial [Tanacetum coccineum]